MTNKNLNSAKYSFFGIFSNTLWFGIVPKLPSLINVLLLPIITPYLSAWDYGIWGEISAYTSFATAFCTMGLNVHLSNSYYEYGSKFHLVWSRINFILHLLSLICASVLFVVLWFSLLELDLIYRLLITLMSIIPALLYPNQLLAQHLFPLRAKPKPLVLRNFIASVLGIGSLYIAVVDFRLGYIGFVLSSAVTAIVAYFLFLAPLRKEKIKLVSSNKFSRVKNWLVIGFPLIPQILGFTLLSSSSRIVMELCGISTEEIGLFTNGVTIGGYVVILTSAMASALSPLMQQFYRKDEIANFRRLFYIDFVITFISVFIFSVWMKEIYFVLVKNEELYKAYSIAQIVCYSNLIYPFYHFTSTIICIQKKTQHILWLTFVPGVVCVLLNFILLPIWGYKIATWVSVISYWIQFILPLIIPYLRIITKYWLGSIWIMPAFAVCAAICIVLIGYISETTIVTKISMTFALVIPVGLLLRTLHLRIAR